MFILLRGRKTALRWVLITLSTILFLLCTVHVGASLRQWLEAFVYVSDNVPNYSTTYWLDNTNKLTILKNYLYDTLVLAQYSILIWRLYVVFMCNWRVVVLPVILGIGCVVNIFAVSVLTAHPNVSLHTSVVSNLIAAAWVLDMILNVLVTGAIAARLWWMGRKLASSMATRANDYASAISVVIESGAIMLATNIAILALYASKSPTSFAILDVASQLAGLVPFLIVVQVGLTGRYHIPPISSVGSSSTAIITQDGMIFRAGTSEEQDLGRDIPLRMYTK